MEKEKTTYVVLEFAAINGYYDKTKNDILHHIDVLIGDGKRKNNN